MLRLSLLAVVLLAALTAAFAAPVTIKVVGPDDAPIPGAYFTLRTPYDDTYYEHRTDDAGICTLELAEQNAMAGYVGYATAYAPGFAMAQDSLQVGENVIKLTTPVSVSGKVVDALNQPVADAIVTVNGFKLPGSRYSFISIPEPFKKFFTAKTDAEGRWTMTDIPAICYVDVILEDPRYVRQRGYVPSSTDIEPLPREFQEGTILRARPAAVITGKLLTPEGTPAVGVRLFTRMENYIDGAWGSATTGEDGTYLISSLPSAIYSLDIEDNENRWAKMQIPNITAVEGQTATVPDTTLSAGALIEGTVTEAETSAPVPHVRMLYYGPASEDEVERYAQTDANGRYQFRIMPGKGSVKQWQPPQEYVWQRDLAPVPVETQLGETKTLNFKLSKGLTVSGTVTDEQGNPVTGVYLSMHILSGKNGDRIDWNDLIVLISPDTNGKFTVSGLMHGKARVILGNESEVLGNIMAAGDWEVAAPTALQLPTADPIRIVLRKIQYESLTGRVITPDGKPVADVKIECHKLIPTGYNFNAQQSQMTQTDADGRFTIDKLQQDMEVNLIAVTKEGYVLTTLGEVNVKAGRITDTVLTPLLGKLSGTVTDHTGKPVKDATVICLNLGIKTRKVTAADGKFALTALPEGDADLLAITAESVALWHGKTGDMSITMTLRPPVTVPPGDKPRVLTMLEEDAKLPPEQRRLDRDAALESLAKYDFELALQLAQAGPAPMSEKLRLALLRVLIEKDPARAAKVGPQQLDYIMKPEERLDAALTLGAAVAATNPNVGAHCYAIAKDLIDKVGDKSSKIYNRAHLLKLALLLHLPEADALLETTYDMAKDYQEGYYLTTLCFYVAEADWKLAEKVWSRLDGQLKAQCIGSALPSIAAADIPMAIRMAEEVQKPNSGGYSSDSLLSIIPALAKTDPQQALAYARAQKSNLRTKALMLAAKYLPKEEAIKTLQEAFTLIPEYPDQLRERVRCAAQTYLLDPAIGKQLLQATYQRYQSYGDDPEVNRDPWSEQRNLISLSYSYAIIDPVESRLLLETTYASAKQRAKSDKDFYGTLYDFPVAMAPLDIDRALAMANELNVQSPGAGEHAYREIVRYILASEEERLTSFLRY